MKRSRLSWWPKSNWDIYAWLIWVRITLKYGIGNTDIPKERILGWLDYNKWIKEFDANGGSVSDLRGVARNIVKAYEEKYEQA